MNLKMWNKWKDFRLNEDLKEDGHTDVPSAIRKLKTSIEDANEITQKLQSMSDEESLPSWWSDKITLSANYLNKARDYILNPNESVNENREIDKVYGDFEVLLKDFEKEFISLSAQAGRANDNKADERIMIKTLKKHLPPLYSMVRSWNRSSKRD
tara:strand:- start:3526 stop:3990 length:465 start_codon:yes stop_codon:yes gene_type:complete